MKKLYFCLIATILLFTSCDYPTKNLNSIAKAPIVQPIDYGNGVFYFSVRQAQFGKSLSDFIGKNKDREVIAISGDGAPGGDLGYFVVTRKKE